MSGYEVAITRKAYKSSLKMPECIRDKLAALVEELSEMGPIRNNWPNYGKLSANEYHCHLARKWVACWRHMICVHRNSPYKKGLHPLSSNVPG